MLKEREQEIIRQVQQGNTALFSELVDHYKDPAFSLCVRICGNRDDAADICQESFIKAFRALSNFRGEAGFATWFYRIVYNSAISYLRIKKIKTIPLENFPDIEGCEDQEEDVTTRKLVRKIISELPEIDRSIVTLYYLLDHTISEISKITGLTESNIKVRLHRCRIKMHEEISIHLHVQIA